MMDEKTSEKLLQKIPKLKFGSLKSSIALVFLIIALLLSFYLNQDPPAQKPQSLGIENAKFEGPFEVSSVVDGDTIKIKSGLETLTIRYIGVDTPETVKPNTPVQCFGKEASNFNKSLVENKEVYLEVDVGSRDSFGRELRYVYLKNGDDFDMINKTLIREGYAKTLTIPPNVKYSQDFIKLESEARENQRGLWEKCIGQ